MYKSIAVVRHNANDFISKNIMKNGYRVVQAYKNTNYISYLLWKFLKKHHLPGQAFWYNKKLVNLNVDTIILIESMLTLDFVEWVRENNPNSRIIFWYWNIVQNTIHPAKISDSSIEKWSFSEKDCERYGLSFNPPFYFNNIELNQNGVEYDLYFAGKNKGRLPMLLEFKKKTEALGIKTYLHISPTKRIELIFNPRDLRPSISYEEVLNGLSKSKAILDIIEVTDSGQSQRTMESVFFEKKLVTNSILIKNFDFYNPENIFILGEDNVETLPTFLSTPYVKIDEHIISKYDVQTWIKRFMIN